MILTWCCRCISNLRAIKRIYPPHTHHHHPPRHYYFMWGNLWIIESERMAGERDKQKSKQEASLIFNSPMKSNLPQQGIVLSQQGSMAATLMKTCFGPSPPYYLQFWNRRNPGFRDTLSFSISLIGEMLAKLANSYFTLLFGILKVSSPCFVLAK